MQRNFILIILLKLCYTCTYITFVTNQENNNNDNNIIILLLLMLWLSFIPRAKTILIVINFLTSLQPSLKSLTQNFIVSLPFFYYSPSSCTLHLRTLYFFVPSPFVEQAQYSVGSFLVVKSFPCIFLTLCIQTQENV